MLTHYNIYYQLITLVIIITSFTRKVLGIYEAHSGRCKFSKIQIFI